jgi:hypothetical protein
MSKATLFILRFLPSSKEFDIFALGRVRPPGKVRPPTLSSVVSYKIKILFLPIRCDQMHAQKIKGRSEKEWKAGKKKAKGMQQNEVQYKRRTNLTRVGKKTEGRKIRYQTVEVMRQLLSSLTITAYLESICIYIDQPSSPPSRALVIIITPLESS